MNKFKKFNSLKELIKKPIFRASEAREVGVSSSLLCYYVQQGLIERVDRGVYRGIEPVLDVDFRWEDIILVTKSISGGVVCLISALALYELTDEIPRVHWIAVDNTKSAPKRKGTKIFRTRNIELGRTEIQVGSETITIFDKERTIIDTFRYMGKETAIKALKNSLTTSSEEKIDLKKLQNYAKKLRVNITPYILAVTI
ncbi:type IV toxin-antitoxin system AbiEi family antitoxin domain-containing protein [Candidatus Halobeggiatoa sp. HSG11]|nr:type IV toxin-antitoxin system AbiEi family antitoxin domain-containing protein [Candidatus Halobeggiatoa sp. HSG11]